MAVNYIVVKSNFKEGAAAGSKYLKVIKDECIEKYKMARIISDQCSITEADIVSVLQAYETNLKIQFSEGNSVELFNLGTLKPYFKADFDSNGKVNKQSVRLSKVMLINNDTFINEAKGYIYKYCGEVDYSKNGIEERISLAIDFLERKKSYITSSDYAELNTCTTTTANRDLKMMKKAGILSAEKIGHTFIYSLNRENFVSNEKFQEKKSEENIYQEDELAQQATDNIMISDKISFDTSEIANNNIVITKDMSSLKTDLTISRRIKRIDPSDPDNPVEIYYNALDGNYSKKISPHFDNVDYEIFNEEQKIIYACECAMKKIASDIGAEDIYDSRVLDLLDKNTFPIKMLLRIKRKREIKT